jgi:hypothetical protein
MQNYIPVYQPKIEQTRINKYSRNESNNQLTCNGNVENVWQKLQEIGKDVLPQLSELRKIDPNLEKMIAQNPRLLWSKQDYLDYVAKIVLKSERDWFEAEDFKIVFLKIVEDKNGDKYYYIGVEINEVTKENGLLVKNGRIKIIYEYKNGQKIGKVSSGNLSGCGITNQLLSQSDSVDLKRLKDYWEKSIDKSKMHKRD